jgi:2-C-methyl-D-erythritol 4-phosphate cytidylyltransferase
MTTGAVILAAGRGERMGGIDKLLYPLAGRPLLAHSIAVIATHSEIEIDGVVVVASEASQGIVRDIVAEIAPFAKVVLGGDRRRDSVLAGIEALPNCDYVLIHDGARPLVTPEMVDLALAGARETGAALCAVPVADTVKRADSAGLVQSTVSREGLWLAQTPQAFRSELLLRAHAASDIDVTDDAALVELLGEAVRLVMGSQQNIKVTTPSDLALADALMASRRG